MRTARKTAAAVFLITSTKFLNSKESYNDDKTNSPGFGRYPIGQ